MMTDERTFRRRTILAVTGFIGLCAPSMLLAKEVGGATGAASENSEDAPQQESDGALAGFRVGTALGIAQRQVVDDNPLVFTPGVLAEARFGAAISPIYVTGAGVRGAWSVLAVKDLKLDSGARARDLQLVEGTAYWFHQWDFSEGGNGGMRLALGPHVSMLLADDDVLSENALVGGELSLELRVLRSALPTNWTTNLWLGLSVSHSFENGSNVDSIEAQDRETSAKVLIAFDLEKVPGRTASLLRQRSSPRLGASLGAMARKSSSTRLALKY
jgi:hypothetical protein